MWRAEGSGLTLTREVDGVQRHPLGLDETSDPLQLSLAHVVLEEDVVGEAHAADGLGALAADCDVAVAGVNLESHGLRDGALVVLHSASSWTWRTIEGKRFRMSACQKSDWVFFRDTMPAAVEWLLPEVQRTPAGLLPLQAGRPHWLFIPPLGLFQEVTATFGR